MKEQELGINHLQDLTSLTNAINDEYTRYKKLPKGIVLMPLKID
jgi:hypothetical protein